MTTEERLAKLERNVRVLRDYLLYNYEAPRDATVWDGIPCFRALERIK